MRSAAWSHVPHPHVVSMPSAHLLEGRRSASVFAVTPATRTPTARPTHAPPTLAARTPSARTTVGLQCASVPLNTSATLTSRAETTHAAVTCAAPTPTVRRVAHARCVVVGQVTSVARTAGLAAKQTRASRECAGRAPTAKTWEAGRYASVDQDTREIPTLVVSKESVMRTLTVDLREPAKIISASTRVRSLAAAGLTATWRITWQSAAALAEPRVILSPTAADSPVTRFARHAAPIQTARLDLTTGRSASADPLTSATR